MGTEARSLAEIDLEIGRKARELKALMLERERATGEGEPVTFLEIETAVGQMTRQVGREIMAEVVQDRAAALRDRLEVVPCPTCGKSCRRKEDEKTWDLRTLEGTVRIGEPVYYCSACRRAFFPSAC